MLLPCSIVAVVLFEADRSDGQTPSGGKPIAGRVRSGQSCPHGLHRVPVLRGSGHLVPTLSPRMGSNVLSHACWRRPVTRTSQSNLPHVHGGSGDLTLMRTGRSGDGDSDGARSCSVGAPA
jgi:hypothetical protein